MSKCLTVSYSVFFILSLASTAAYTVYSGLEAAFASNLATCPTPYLALKYANFQFILLLSFFTSAAAFLCQIIVLGVLIGWCCTALTYAKCTTAYIFLNFALLLMVVPLAYHLSFLLQGASCTSSLSATTSFVLLALAAAALLSLLTTLCINLCAFSTLSTVHYDPLQEKTMVTEAKENKIDVEEDRYIKYIHQTNSPVNYVRSPVKQPTSPVKQSTSREEKYLFNNRYRQSPKADDSPYQKYKEEKQVQRQIKNEEDETIERERRSYLRQFDRGDYLRKSEVGNSRVNNFQNNEKKQGMLLSFIRGKYPA